MFSCKKIIYFLIIVLMIALMSLGLFLNYSPLETAQADSLGEWVDITNKSYTVQDSVMHDVKIVSEGQIYSTVTSLAEGESKTQAYKVNGSGTVADGRYKSNNLIKPTILNYGILKNGLIVTYDNLTDEIVINGTAIDNVENGLPLLFGINIIPLKNIVYTFTVFSKTINPNVYVSLKTNQLVNTGRFFNVNMDNIVKKYSRNYDFINSVDFLCIGVIAGTQLVDYRIKIMFEEGSGSSNYQLIQNDYNYSSTSIPALKGGKIYGNVLEGNAKIYIKMRDYTYKYNIDFITVPLVFCSHNNVGNDLITNKRCIDSSCSYNSVWADGILDFTIHIYIDDTFVGKELKFVKNYSVGSNISIIRKNETSAYYVSLPISLEFFGHEPPFSSTDKFRVKVITFAEESSLKNLLLVSDYTFNYSTENKITLDNIKSDKEILITETIYPEYIYKPDSEHYDKGKEDGYNIGYDKGHNDGYLNGFNKDKNDKVNAEVSDFLKSWKGLLPNVFGSIASFFLVIGQIQIFGSTLTELVVSLCGLVFLFFIVKLIFAR